MRCWLLILLTWLSCCSSKHVDYRPPKSSSLPLLFSNYVTSLYPLLQTSSPHASYNICHSRIVLDYLECSPHWPRYLFSALSAPTTIHATMHHCHHRPFTSTAPSAYHICTAQLELLLSSTTRSSSTTFLIIWLTHAHIPCLRPTILVTNLSKLNRGIYRVISLSHLADTWHTATF